MLTHKSVGHPQLILEIQERIEKGDYAPGSWLPAERALAQEFGVDRSAIRRALFQLESDGLIVREAGKRPYVRSILPPPMQRQGRVAPNMSGLRTIVAILPQHPVYPASQAILHGIHAALSSAEAPFRLQVLDTHGGGERRQTSLEKQALDSVIEENIAGVVLWHMGGAETLPQLRALQERGTPIVFVDRFPAELPCDFVGGDNRTGIEDAIAYLRQLGHHRIAHLTTDEQSTAVLERLSAYLENMSSVNSQPDPGLIYKCSYADTTNIAPACDQFFSLVEPPTAVLAMNDSLAYQFMAVCEQRGVEVPRDISLIGFDDLERHSPRPALLTTLHQPFGRMGRRAADLLLSRLSGSDLYPSVKQHLRLQTPLIKRATCRAYSGNDKH